MSKTAKTEYQEVSLESVVYFFRQGFTPKEGEEIKSYEWWLAQRADGKQQIIFRLFITKDEGAPPSP